MDLPSSLSNPHPNTIAFILKFIESGCKVDIKGVVEIPWRRCLPPAPVLGKATARRRRQQRRADAQRVLHDRRVVNQLSRPHRNAAKGLMEMRTRGVDVEKQKMRIQQVSCKSIKKLKFSVSLEKVEQPASSIWANAERVRAKSIGFHVFVVAASRSKSIWMTTKHRQSFSHDPKFAYISHANAIMTNFNCRSRHRRGEPGNRATAPS